MPDNGDKKKWRAAGKSDKFKLETIGFDIEEDKNKPRKLETKVSSSDEIIGILSSDLEEGVTIKAYPGGKNIEKDGKEL